MAYLGAARAIDFAAIPELELLDANPVYSARSVNGFTATKGAFALNVKGSDFAYDNGKPVEDRGLVNILKGVADGEPSFTIKDIDIAYGRLFDALSESLDYALDQIFRDDDTLNGSPFDDHLIGYDGADAINGRKGNDVVDGRHGGDTLNGGKGRDTLIGGMDKDADSFVFDTAAGKANADTVSRFRKEDVCHLDNDVFTSLEAEGPLKAKYFHKGSQARDANDFALYDRATGKLFYDRDGSGDAGKKLIAIFTAKPDIDHSDLMVI
jgi:Ca2+-binding RTX toxin-like protein